MDNKLGRRDFLGTVALAGAAAAATRTPFIGRAHAAEADGAIISQSASELGRGDPIQEAYFESHRRSSP